MELTRNERVNASVRLHSRSPMCRSNSYCADRRHRPCALRLDRANGPELADADTHSSSPSGLVEAAPHPHAPLHQHLLSVSGAVWIKIKDCPAAAPATLLATALTLSHCAVRDGTSFTDTSPTVRASLRQQLSLFHQRHFRPRVVKCTTHRHLPQQRLGSPPSTTSLHFAEPLFHVPLMRHVPCTLRPSASENVHRPRTSRSLHALERAPWNHELLPCLQFRSIATHDNSTLSFDDEHVLIEVMGMLSRDPIVRTAPERDLTSVSTVENISLDIVRELRFHCDTVEWILHECWKVSHSFGSDS